MRCRIDDRRGATIDRARVATDRRLVTDAQNIGSTRRRLRFGVFEFDARSLELWKNGRAVAVRPQPLKLLALLLHHPGAVVSREDIQRALWSEDTFVDFEQGVNHAVRELRTALSDVAESPRFIQTLPRRGYRFLPPVEALASPEPSGIVSPHSAPLPDAGEAASSAPPIDGVSAHPTRQRWRGVLAASALGAVVAAMVGLSPALRVGDEWSATRRPVLSIQPFETPPDDAITGVGLARAISTRLGGQQALAVSSGAPGRSAAALAPPDPAPAPHATHVLSGRLKRSGADVSVVTELRATDGSVLWSGSLRVRADQLFDVESVIAERVVSTLRIRLARAEQERLRRRYTRDQEAYRAYLRGREALVAYTPAGAQDAVRAFEGALSHDPGYALARAGLAMAAADMYLRFSPPKDVEQWGARAESEARTALALDADLAEAHLARAAVARKREFDWNATIDSSQRALLLNPNLEQAHLFTAAAYYHLGYMDEARIALEKGSRLHGPDVIEPVRIDALIALFSGSFAPARARLEDVSRLSSQAIGDTYLALAYYYTGSAERARTMLTSLAKASSASTSARAGVALAGVLAAQGDAAGARAQLERVSQLGYRDHHVAYGFGAAHAQLAHYAQAMDWLRIAADTGFPCLPFFERDPLLEPLRSRSEYQDLLTHVRARRDASLSAMTGGS